MLAHPFKPISFFSLVIESRFLSARFELLSKLESEVDIFFGEILSESFDTLNRSF